MAQNRHSQNQNTAMCAAIFQLAVCDCNDMGATSVF